MTLRLMRTVSLCALLFGLGCSGESKDEPLGGLGGAPSGGTVTSGGAAAVPNGGTASGGLSGGASSSGSGGAFSGAGNGGASSGGSSSGGLGQGGSARGGASNGGSVDGGASQGGTGKGGAGNGGSVNGGASGGRTSSGGGAAGFGNGGRGGQSNGGAGGTAGVGKGGTAATGGSGGSGGCVKNIACKLAAPPSTGDLHQDCVDRINQFLTQCACLPALTRRTDGEACADQMAEYDASKNMAHAGFTDKICTPAGSQNSCPGYSSNAQVIGLCMQQMWDEGPPPTSSCTGACYEQYGHFINMTDKSVTKVACGFYTTAAGKVWAVQNFSR
jgi:hypothetical protein